MSEQEPTEELNTADEQLERVEQLRNAADQQAGTLVNTMDETIETHKQVDDRLEQLQEDVDNELVGRRLSRARQEVHGRLITMIQFRNMGRDQQPEQDGKEDDN